MFDGLVTNAARRRDPTRTTMLRQRYASAANERVRVVRSLIVETVATNDALLLDPGRRLAIMARKARKAKAKRRYDFPSDPAGKAQAFMDWLYGAMDDEILEVIQRSGRQVVTHNAWQNVYVRGAYAAAIEQASGEMRRAGYELASYSLAGVLNAPMHADALGLLFARNFNELAGVTDAMGQEIARVLAEGLSSGIGPREIARLMADRVDKIGIVRATKIARTEIIRAHAEATLNRYEELGIGQVVLLEEFLTAQDNKVCDVCRGLARQDNGYGPGIFTIAAARGLIPVHPNCRCAWRLLSLKETAKAVK